MIKICRVVLSVLFVLSFASIATAQNSFFTDVNADALSRTAGKRVLVPEKYRTVSLNVKSIKTFLSSLPEEKNIANRNTTPVIELPMPSGGTARFRVWESSVMEPALAAKFPGIKTFAGQGIDDPAAYIRFDFTTQGFHAMILSDVSGDIYIDPYQQTDIEHYNVYYKRDFKKGSNFICGEDPLQIPPATTNIAARIDAGVCSGTQLRTYRLALACTGEYAVAVCPAGQVTTANTLSAMVTSVNRVTGVYEKDLAVRLVLVNNTTIIYLNGAGDPYTNDNPSPGYPILSENQTNITNVVGSANYDIGHVFSTASGGVASLGVVCNTSNKARGTTGVSNPVGDPFDIDYVAHEIGHQFNGTHTFNATTGACSGNRTASTAVEPGSGITIMAYAGICDAGNDLAPNSIAVFHAASIEQIGTFVNNIGTCAVSTATGNNIPVVNAGTNYTIPRSTPFILTGSATDADGDVLSYSWEQIDIGSSGNWNAPSGNAPLFRSFLPVATPVRFFPKLSDVINNATTIGEILPSYARTMNFRLTARDNKAGGGGLCAADMQVTVSDGGGPFKINMPSATGISWPGTSQQTVTWDVVGTNAAPVSCANVTIQLSTDGGLTFPTTLIASTPNDGSEQVILPSVATTTARIRVMAIGNIFYDMSDNNFAITIPQPGFTLSSPATAQVACGSNSSSITLQTSSVLGYSTAINFSATGNPAGTTVSFSPASVTPGANTVVTLSGVNTLSYGNTYNIVVTAVSGSSTKTQTLSYTIVPGTGPSVTTAPVAKQVCEGGSTTFTVASGNVIAAYQWQFSSNNGGSYANVTNGNTASYTIQNAEKVQNGYLYRVILTGQCNTTTTAGVLLTVHTLPVVSLAAAPATSLEPGNITTLTATPSAASANSTVATTWYKNNALITVTNNQLQRSVIDLGSYQVKVSETWNDGNVCTNQSQIVTLTAKASTRLFIYPSPSTGDFTVSYYNAAGTNTSQTIVVYDAKGARVYNAKFAVNNAYELHQVKLTKFSKGLYIVVIGDANGKKITEGKVLVR